MTTEKLTQYHTAPSEFPTPAMVYGGAPMMSEGAPSKFDLSSVEYRPDPIADLQDELATLRADNDARGAVIEQLRAERDQVCRDLVDALNALERANERTDNMRDERNQAHAAYSHALGELDELRNAIDIANARADRQAARAERAEAELARQKRVTALMAKVAREMTKEDE
jgi:chromosome segregation ATPase